MENKTLDIVYKNYEYSLQVNDWGYYEAVSILDCDAQIITSRTIEGLKTEIDELFESKDTGVLHAVGDEKSMWQFSYDEDFNCIEFEIMIASDEDEYEKGKEFVGETAAPYLWYRLKIIP